MSTDDGASEIALNGETRLPIDKSQKSEGSVDEKAEIRVSSDQPSNTESFKSTNGESTIPSDENIEAVIPNGSVSECTISDTTIEFTEPIDTTSETESIDLCHQNTLDKDSAQKIEDKE